MHGRGCHGKAAGPDCAHRYFAGHLLMTAQRHFDGGQQVGLTSHFEQRAALDVVQVIQSENSRKCGIGEDNAFVAADYGHTFDHAAQDGGGAIALVRQHTDAGVQARSALVERGRELFESFAIGRGFHGSKIARAHAAGEFLEAANSS